jgi:hypothetical protein
MYPLNIGSTNQLRLGALILLLCLTPLHVLSQSPRMALDVPAAWRVSFVVVHV